MDALELFYKAAEEGLTETEASWVERELREQPYFTLLHFIRARHAVNTGSPELDSLRTMAAVYAPDRKRLAEYLKPSGARRKPEANAEPPASAKPAPIGPETSNGGGLKENIASFFSAEQKPGAEAASKPTREPETGPVSTDIPLDDKMHTRIGLWVDRCRSVKSDVRRQLTEYKEATVPNPEPRKQEPEAEATPPPARSEQPPKSTPRVKLEDDIRARIERAKHQLKSKSEKGKGKEDLQISLGKAKPEDATLTENASAPQTEAASEETPKAPAVSNEDVAKPADATPGAETPKAEEKPELSEEQKIYLEKYNRFVNAKDKDVEGFILTERLTTGFMDRFVFPEFDPKPATLTAYRVYLVEGETITSGLQGEGELTEAKAASAETSGAPEEPEERKSPKELLSRFLSEDDEDVDTAVAPPEKRTNDAFNRFEQPNFDQKAQTLSEYRKYESEEPAFEAAAGEEAAAEKMKDATAPQAETSEPASAAEVPQPISSGSFDRFIPPAFDGRPDTLDQAESKPVGEASAAKTEQPGKPEAESLQASDAPKPAASADVSAEQTPVSDKTESGTAPSEPVSQTQDRHAEAAAKEGETSGGFNRFVEPEFDRRPEKKQAEAEPAEKSADAEAPETSGASAATESSEQKQAEQPKSKTESEGMLEPKGDPPKKTEPSASGASKPSEPADSAEDKQSLVNTGNSMKRFIEPDFIVRTKEMFGEGFSGEAGESQAKSSGTEAETKSSAEVESSSPPPEQKAAPEPEAKTEPESAAAENADEASVEATEQTAPAAPEPEKRKTEAPPAEAKSPSLEEQGERSIKRFVEPEFDTRPFKSEEESKPPAAAAEAKREQPPAEEDVPQDRRESAPQPATETPKPATEEKPSGEDAPKEARLGRFVEPEFDDGFAFKYGDSQAKADAPDESKSSGPQKTDEPAAGKTEAGPEESSSFTKRFVAPEFDEGKRKPMSAGKLDDDAPKPEKPEEAAPVAKAEEPAAAPEPGAKKPDPEAVAEKTAEAAPVAKPEEPAAAPDARAETPEPEAVAEKPEEAAPVAKAEEPAAAPEAKAETPEPEAVAEKPEEVAPAAKAEEPAAAPEPETERGPKELTIDSSEPLSASEGRIPAELALPGSPEEDITLEIKLRPEHLKYFNIDVGQVSAGLAPPAESPQLSDRSMKMLTLQDLEEQAKEGGPGVNLDKVIIDYSQQTIEFIIDESDFAVGEETTESGARREVTEDITQLEPTAIKAIVPDYQAFLEQALSVKDSYTIEEAVTLIQIIVERTEAENADFLLPELNFQQRLEASKETTGDDVVEFLTIRESFTEEEACELIKMVYDKTESEDPAFVVKLLELPEYLQSETPAELVAGSSENIEKSKQILERISKIEEGFGELSGKEPGRVAEGETPEFQPEEETELEDSNKKIDERISRFRQNLARLRDRSIASPADVNVKTIQNRFLSGILNSMSTGESRVLSSKDASTPPPPPEPAPETEAPETGGGSQLRDLIKRFEEFEPTMYQRLEEYRANPEFEDFQVEDEPEEAAATPVMTETMARLHARQGNLEQAREIIGALKLKNPEKSRYFDDLIKDLNL